MQQELLDLFENEPQFNNFIKLGNEAVYEALFNQTQQYINIIGNNLHGKTHLLKAWVNYKLSLKKNSAIYIDLANNKYYVNSLRNLADKYQFIAIDDVDILTDKQQIAIFDLFNNIKLNNLSTSLLTSSSDATYSKLREDLKTRLLSGLTISLKSSNDEDLIKILQIYNLSEGINISDIELKYLISHYTRNIGVLINTIKLLAKKALLENRNITIPFIKQLLF